MQSEVQNLLTTYSIDSEQIKLGLIGLLTQENTTLAKSVSTPGVNLSEDFTDYYADLIVAVATLHDVRSIASLVGAMDSGGISLDALASFGDSSIDQIIPAIYGNDTVLQFAAVIVLERMLLPNNFPTLSVSTKVKIGMGLLKASNSIDQDTTTEAVSGLNTFNTMVGKLVVGDLNDVGSAGCDDLAIVKASFGKRVGQVGFDIRADVNGDGIVNVLDLATVARQLPAGTVCQ